MNPIGYLRSPFTFKNGTPRQASVCRQARGAITIEKSVFNNPEHSLEGLEEFTHIWILFIFHKNNNAYTKAKVKPPRLNGAKVGLFSTRSPYRPNNIGLTLAKIERIEGASITVSGIDILDGTPVIDIKPYIHQYDHPGFLPGSDNDMLPAEGELNKSDEPQETFDQTVDSEEEHKSILGFEKGDQQTASQEHIKVYTSSKCLKEKQVEDVCCAKNNANNTVGKSLESITKSFEPNEGLENKVWDTHPDKRNETALTEVIREKTNINSTSDPNTDDCLDDTTLAAKWISSPPVSALQVLLTERALQQLEKFSSTSSNSKYRLKFMKSNHEVRDAIVNILHEDPRSVYRRTKCVDSLYYFTVDVVHVTCWFDMDGDGNSSERPVVEVVRVKPACDVTQCKDSFNK